MLITCFFMPLKRGQVEFSHRESSLQTVKYTIPADLPGVILKIRILIYEVLLSVPRWMRGIALEAVLVTRVGCLFNLSFLFWSLLFLTILFFPLLCKYKSVYPAVPDFFEMKIFARKAAHENVTPYFRLHNASREAGSPEKLPSP